MGFLHRALSIPAYAQRMLLVAAICAAALFALFGAMYAHRAEACGFWGPCTIPVYLTSYTISPDPIYTGFGGPTVSWSSTPADFCVLYFPPGGSVVVPPSGSYAGADYGAGWHVYTIKCDNTGDADEGTTGFVNKGYTAQNCPAGWSPASQTSCNPPPAPYNDTTVDCAAENELGCPGGTYNNTGQVTKPTSGTKYLTVRTSHAPKTGDSLVAGGIVQLPGNGSAAGSVNPDNYPLSPGSYGNAQVARGSANNYSYAMPITASTPAGVYYFYPVTATNFHAWNNYGSTPGGWQRMASITVVEPAVLPTVSVAASGSPGEPSTTGTFTVSRTGSTGSALSVNATIGGTATRCTAANISTCATSTDYLLTNCSISSTNPTVTLTIPSGQASCAITLTPKDNTSAESSETATLTITSSSSYSLGATLGSLSISDNDSGVSCTSASNGGATGTYPSCTCNNTGTYTSSSNSCGNPSCSTATPGGASGTYPSCTCSNGGTYSSSNHTCSVSSATFQIDANDPSIAKGSSDSLSITARRTSGSSAPIYPYIIFWNAGSAPSGVTEGGLTPGSCTPGTSWAPCGSETLTVSTSATSGTYSGTVYYLDGSSQPITTPFTLTITAAAAFSFTLSPNSYNVSATPGQTVTNTIGAYALSGSGTVDGFYATVPDGWSYSFPAPNSCTATNLSCATMEINVPAGATPGEYPVSVYASGSGSTSGSGSFSVNIAGEGGGGGGLVVEVLTGDDAGEPGTGQGSGTFALSRTGGEYGVSVDLPVYFEISGTAVYGEDYTLDGTCSSITINGATIPTGSASCVIEVIPIGDSPLEESPETVTITLLPGPYTGGTTP